ncbi:unnamed protein product, partial [Brachionus calyciflorus]
ANLKEFIEWSGDFSDYDRESHWAYADYKHMIELPIDFNCIDWSNFGFKNRNAKDSTLWIGSKGAYTPCHYDTYGYNLVYQIHGVKRWIMFSPLDSPCLYPTRVPFEESTWHYVESLSESISINTWVEIEGIDDLARLKEILCKCLIQGVMESNFVNVDKWINSSESYSEIYVESINFDDYLNKLTLKIDKEEEEQMENDEDINPLLKSFSDSLADSKIIDLIAQNLIRKFE